jgi:hypothetical protein
MRVNQYLYKIRACVRQSLKLTTKIRKGDERDKSKEEKEALFPHPTPVTGIGLKRRRRR